jgi:hypothetical protein
MFFDSILQQKTYMFMKTCIHLYILSLQHSVLQAVDDSLKSVNLFHGGVGDKQVGKYSGGMKRRLSVAISLIGDPKVPPSLLFMFFSPEYTLASATYNLIPLGSFHGRAKHRTRSSIKKQSVVCREGGKEKPCHHSYKY